MNPFSIPNLPTDNLYKFYSISGLVILIFTITFEIIFINNLNEKIENLEYSSQIIKLQSDYLSEDIEYLKSKTENLKKEVDKYKTEKDSIRNKSEEYDEMMSKLKSDSNYRDYLKFKFDYSEKLMPEEETLFELIKLAEKYRDSEREYNLKIIEHKFKSNQISTKINELKFILFLGLIFILFGVIMTIKGFRLWKIKVQDPLDKKLEIELRQLEKNDSE